MGSDLYPVSEPYAEGLLDVGDGNLVHWAACGNPDGKPALVVHGGPGSGAGTSWTRWFDPAAYRIVLFDQRGCGRSTPDAGLVTTDLSVNTTQHLMSDMEQLRENLGIERWLLFGGSWGAALSLAYAEEHPSRVSEIVLVSITNGTPREVEWITRDMGRIFPAEWARFRDHLPPDLRDGNLAAGYARLLADPDPAVRDAAAVEWCRWEDTHVATHPGHKSDPRYADPVLRLRIARLVTHYWGNDHFLEDGILLREAGKLAGIPGVLVHGRLDISGPLDTAWHLAAAWPDAELVVIGEAGHGAGNDAVRAALVAATDRFAGS
ncbi:prolyl aminopeptidase [Streptomyces boninensis]|uniref:prolyl aminopeptidase n=1 Tax=Streptomyces boninensis TaxID=2039455 RepID=UPI003B2239DA